MTTPTLTKKQRFNLLRSQLESERSSFLSHWRELNDYILPRRGRFTSSDVNKGDRRTRNIIDSTATYSARTLRSGMMSGVTSPARPWFRLTTPDPDLAENGTVKEWLHVTGQRMSTIFLRSNLYKVLPVVYGDMGVFGTGAMAVLEDDETVIRCYAFPIGSYMLANDAKLQVRVFVREFKMTTRQIVEQFGRLSEGKPDFTNISTNVRNLWERGQFEDWIDVCHVIAPNGGYDSTKLEAKFKRFSGCYYEKASDEDKILEESGFDEFPILAPRWEVTGEDVYGTDCPGMTALGDIKQLQLMEKRGAQGLEKMVNPPMVAPPSMRSAKLTLLPGDVSFVQEAQNASFRPAHEVSLPLDQLEAKEDQIRFRVQRAFHEDLFLMLSNLDRKEITATEIMERREEKLLALGPVLEQLNQDLLDPLIDRTFAIMVRRGLIPEPPEELQGVTLKVEYISVMAQAQQQAGLAGIDRLATFVSTLAEAKQDPSVFDKFDIDQAIDEYGQMTGVPPRLIVPDEQVAAMRQARAEQQQAAQQAETLATTAAGARDLSQADTSGKNALTDLLGAA